MTGFPGHRESTEAVTGFSATITQSRLSSQATTVLLLLLLLLLLSVSPLALALALAIDFDADADVDLVVVVFGRLPTVLVN